MRAVHRAVLEEGFEDLWSWLGAHPRLTWEQVGAELGIPAVVVMRAARESASSVSLEVRHALLRELNEHFAAGWDNTARLRRAKLGGALFASMNLEDDQLDRLMQLLDQQPQGWLPAGLEDRDLVELVDTLALDLRRVETRRE